MTIVMHLAECEPWKHPEWKRTTHRAGAEAGAVMCDETQYMATELYPGEEVWTELVTRAASPAEQGLAELAAALDQAKVRWDHADAPYDPDLLTLFRAGEKVLALFHDGTGQ